jgi:hypothetical protein
MVIKYSPSRDGTDLYGRTLDRGPISVLKQAIYVGRVSGLLKDLHRCGHTMVPIPDIVVSLGISPS